MLVGHVVEWQIGIALAALQKGEGDFSRLVDDGMVAWDRMLANSMRQAEAIRKERSIPQHAQPLMSDYYQTTSPAGTAERAHHKVERCLEGFVGSEVADKVQQLRKWEWRKKGDDGRSWPEHWEFGGIPVTSSLDHWMAREGKGL